PRRPRAGLPLQLGLDRAPGAGDLSRSGGIEGVRLTRATVLSWHLRLFVAVAMLLGCCAAGLRAQGNYEVQVYASELTPKGVFMVELHSNITAQGTKGVTDGVLPTHHAVHETLEVTHGWNEWFETG